VCTCLNKSEVVFGKQGEEHCQLNGKSAELFDGSAFHLGVGRIEDPED